MSSERAPSSSSGRFFVVLSVMLTAIVLAMSASNSASATCAPDYNFGTFYMFNAGESSPVGNELFTIAAGKGNTCTVEGPGAGSHPVDCEVTDAGVVWSELGTDGKAYPAYVFNCCGYQVDPKSIGIGYLYPGVPEHEGAGLSVTNDETQADLKNCLPTTTTTVKIRPGTMSVALTGERTTAPNTISVTMTLKDTGSTDISGLSFSDPTGLENDGVALKNGNIGPTQSGLTLTSGPTPALPTSLTPNSPPDVIHYTYSAATSGDAVLVAQASGTDAAGNTVSVKKAITVLVSNAPVNGADYQKLVTSALLADDSITSQAQNTITNAEADALATTLNVSGASPGQQAAAVQAGLPPQLGVLAGTARKSDLEQWVGNYATTLATDLKGGASYLGATGKEVMTQLLVAATDPATQDRILGRTWDVLQALPGNTKAALASTATNLGYFGEALAASLTPQGQDTWVKASEAQLTSLQTNVTYAVDGFTAAQVADVNAYNKDPTAYLNANSAHYADATYDLIKTEVATLLGDGIGKGIGLAAKSAGFGGLVGDAKAIDSTVAASIDSTAPVAADSTAALMQKASVATSQFQTLTTDSVLSADQAAQLGGLTPGDQVGVQKAIRYIKDTYGVDLEIGVRTSEPLSVGIAGSPKLSFMKPKAVSMIDMMMGAPSEIAAYSAPGEAASGQVFKGGVTTVFKPVPIPEDVLAAIGETNPDFVTQYESRFASQTKLWNEYQNPNSTLRELVQGSAENQGGVTAITSVPGFPVPPPPAGAQPLVYLQQLDDAAFRAQFGVSEQQAQALKASLANSPAATQVDYIARPNGDGSFSFFDGLNNNRPYVSDLDLQYVQPANGAPWPAGLKSKIQLEFQNQLEQNVARLPDHGASGTAFDLPAGSIGVADGFVMGTANPALAQQIADNLAARYASQTAIFTTNATRLEALAAQTADPVQAAALRAQAAIYRETAAKFATVDAAYLLAKYPPGEKIIVIKLGDVRVGYGAGPKS